MAVVVTVTPNTLVDWLASAPAPAPGRVARVARMEPVAGGKGLNVARVLARLGHRVVAAGFAGGRTGELLRDLVRADGCEPLLVPTAARTRTGFQAVDPRGGATLLLETGFEVSAREKEALLVEVERAIAHAELVVAGGSVPDRSCDDLYERLLELCARANRPCWIDAYGPAMERALAAPFPPALAKPNRTELGGGRGWERCPELHVTDGPREVSVRAPQGAWRVAPPAVRELNPIGSGDCYLAALADARLRGLPFEEQLRRAAAAGAANAARADVARVAACDVDALVPQVVVQPAG